MRTATLKNLFKGGGSNSKEPSEKLALADVF